MIKYRGDTFVIGKKFIINEKEYRFTRRNNSNLIFESVADKSKLAIKESDFNKMLTEKINKDNQEINDIIGKVLRSKGLARKYEDKLKDLGISIDYDVPQGVNLIGPNGKKLSASSKEVFGPHSPDSSKEKYDRQGYRLRNDGHTKTTSKYSKYYADQAEKAKQDLANLENMDRDDIIRKYNDKTTDEALAQHNKDIEYAKNSLDRYLGWDKDEKNSYQRDLKHAKDSRRNAEYNRLNKTTDKDQADSTMDYLNYLTKDANEHMDKIRGNNYLFKSADSKSNPENYVKDDDNPSNVDTYKKLKARVDYAKSDVDRNNATDDDIYSKSPYPSYKYKALTDEQLEAKIQSMRDELEAKIQELRTNNSKNITRKDKDIANLKAREEELDKFLKNRGVRKESQTIKRKGITLTELAKFRARRK